MGKQSSDATSTGKRKMDRETLYNLLDIDIDRWLNPYLPHNRFYILPTPISHLLGHRKTPPEEAPSLVRWILTIFATIAGLCLVGGIYNYAPGIAKWHPPVIVASLGASAVLDYNAVRSPLAQPRNAIIGHTLSAIVGVAIAKGFMLSPSFFANYAWVCAAVSCAGASFVMSLTNTVHPPGGATAILAITEAQIVAMGWIFPLLILLSSVLMTAVACIFNNTIRQYPVYWWTADDVGHKLTFRKRKDGHIDVEDGGHLKKVESSQGTGSESDDATLAHELSNEVQDSEDFGVHIFSYRMQLPRHIELSEQEVEMLRGLQQKIREHAEIN